MSEGSWQGIALFGERGAWQIPGSEEFSVRFAAPENRTTEHPAQHRFWYAPSISSASLSLIRSQASLFSAIGTAFIIKINSKLELIQTRRPSQDSPHLGPIFLFQRYSTFIPSAL